VPDERLHRPDAVRVELPARRPPGGHALRPGPEVVEPARLVVVAMSLRAPFIGTCADCGKRCFGTKRAAKTEPDGSVVTCTPTLRRYWHYGHPPTALVRGLISRDQVGRPGGAR
jgi:hypothetical protein